MPCCCHVHYHDGMIRMQVQFTEEQVRALRDRARAEDRSISDLVRQSVDGLVTQQVRPGRDALARRAREVRGRFRSGVPDLAEEHDRHLAEAFDS